MLSHSDTPCLCDSVLFLFSISVRVRGITCNTCGRFTTFSASLGPSCNYIAQLNLEDFPPNSLVRGPEKIFPLLWLWLWLLFTSRLSPFCFCFPLPFLSLPPFIPPPPVPTGHFHLNLCENRVSLMISGFNVVVKCQDKCGEIDLVLILIFQVSCHPGAKIASGSECQETAAVVCYRNNVFGTYWRSQTGGPIPRCKKLGEGLLCTITLLLVGQTLKSEPSVDRFFSWQRQY